MGDQGTERSFKRLDKTHYADHHKRFGIFRYAVHLLNLGTRAIGLSQIVTVYGRNQKEVDVVIA